MENRLNPGLNAAFSGLQEMHIERDCLKKIRSDLEKIVLQTKQLSNEFVSITDQFIPGPEGTPEIRVRRYEPAVKDGILPGLLWMHGGGYVLGVPEIDDILCTRFVSEVNCVVISVDYRLAPENPFPAPLEDCYAALKWLSENAEDLGADPNRIAVAGASAGGGLATSLSLLARDRKGPSIAFQMPLYPMIDHRNITASTYEITDKRVWNRECNINAWEMYLGASDKANVSPYASPALASDLSGLPPTYTFIGDLDVFRDETIDYVKRLSHSGVPTEFHLYPGCFHGFEAVVTNSEISQRAAAQLVQTLKRALK